MWALSYLGCLIFIDSILCSLLQVWNLQIIQTEIVVLYVALAQDHVGGGTSPGAITWVVAVVDLEAQFSAKELAARTMVRPGRWSGVGRPGRRTSRSAASLVRHGVEGSGPPAWSGRTEEAPSLLSRPVHVHDLALVVQERSDSRLLVLVRRAGRDAVDLCLAAATA